MGHYCPPHTPTFGRTESDEMITAVRACHPDVLFVCLGTPTQEKWIASSLADLQVPVAIGVGAAVDILGGRLRATQGWMTEIGLEWLYRLVQEPKHLARRYLLRGPVFVWMVILEAAGRRLKSDWGRYGMP